MSDFLEELKEAALSVKVTEECLAGWVGRNYDTYPEFNNLTTLINSLGENAQRMMEVGFLQDNLIGLGFKKIVSGYELEAGIYLFIDELVSDKEYQYFDKELDETTVGKLCVTFHADRCVICILTDSRFCGSLY